MASVGLWARLSTWLAADLAIDLGTANTLIYKKNEGILLDEPSVVVLPATGGGVLAIGREAKEMYGRTPDNLRAVRPLKDGVIADFDSANRMIRYFLGKVTEKRPLFRPKMLVSVPSGITQVEKKAVIDATAQAGAKQVLLMEEPMAAAIGSSLDVRKARGKMVVDIGGGTTEIAVISSFAIAYGESIRVAGDEMDDAIVNHVRKRFNMSIGVYEAERVKMEVGCAVPLDATETTEVRGKDLIRGVPTTTRVDSEMVRQALKEPLDTVVDAIKRALDKTPPELSSDILEAGIVLAGGGSLLRGLGPRLNQETGLRIYRAKEPLRAIVRGAGVVLENLKEYDPVLIN